MASVTLTLTPAQAKILFNTVDGAADARACEDGCTPQESEALNDIMSKLLRHHAKWKDAELEPEGFRTRGPAAREGGR